MSAKVDGQLREPSELGVWEEADEAPDMADEKGKFKLDKGNKKSLKAAYNPYIHTSRTMLNDQFSEAQSRPNLVVVEMEVPESELTSGYKAEKAKDSVGAKQWKAGVIQGQLSGTREVILSRWAKPVRIVPADEVAKNIHEQIKGQVETMPSNVVTPEVRAELEKLGVEFVETDNTGKIKEGPNKGETWARVYGKKAPKGREADSRYVFNPYAPHKTYEESLAASRAAGYTKRQHDAMVERRKKNYAERGQRAKEMAEKLNLGGIVEIRENADGLEERFQGKKGWYNPRTGKITVVLDKHGSMDDILQTILHEGVGHHGLREMFGKHFDDFIDNVYNGATLDVRRRIIDLAKHHGWDYRTGTEEYLAQMAETMDFEKPENRSWWQKVKDFFFDMLHKLGIRGAFAEGSNAISDNELSYILWRSYQNLVNPGRYRSFVDEAEDAAMQWKLKVGRYEEQYGELKRAKKGRWYEESPRAAESGIEDVRDELLAAFKEASQGEAKGKRIPIGELTEEGRKYLEQLSGLTMKPRVSFVLNASDLRHIYNEHYGENEKDKGSNIPLTDEDIVSMVDVITQPDRIVYGETKRDGMKLFYFLKDSGNGTYNLAEVYTDKRGNLTAKTFYKTKKGSHQRANDILNSPKLSTSETDGASLNSSAKIPTLFETAKNKSQNAERKGKRRGAYTTKSGVQLTMMSLFEGDPTGVRLRKLKEGETCHVERRYEESRQFSFMGKEKIESMDDVAYIFKQLETAAVENTFLAMVKDGRPTVIHIGMGGYASSPADARQALAAYMDMKPDAVYFVHNHPSGSLRASRDDMNTLQRMRDMFGADVVQDGIIIDTVSGKYCTFGYSGSTEASMPEVEGGEVPVKIYEFSKQVFSPEWNPQEAFKMTDFGKVAEFVSSHRLGEHQKMSLIVTNTQGQVVGNFFLPWTMLSDIENNAEAVREMSNYVNLAGGTAGILYGNYEYDSHRDISALRLLADGMKMMGTPLHDVVHLAGEHDYHSARETGVMEPTEGYEMRVSDSTPQSGMERATAIVAELSAKNRDNADLRDAAVRVIGGNLTHLRKAMSQQREFDRGTVKRVSDLANAMMKGGFLDEISANDVSRLLSAVKHSTGKENIEGGLWKVMDIMIDNHLKRAEAILHKLESVRGSKVDARGVQVQGRLDVAGQRMVDTFKRGRQMQREQLEELMADARERMGSEDQVTADEATQEYAGMQMAIDYIDKIQASETAEEEMYRAIREEERRIYDFTSEPVLDADGNAMLKKDGTPMMRTVRHTKPEYKGSKENPLSEEKKRIRRQVKESVAAMEDAIRKGKIERMQDYMELVGRLSGRMKESMANAKVWAEAQKERVREIQHNANSDMEGRPSNAHYDPGFKEKMANNSFVQFMLQPLATFDQMLRLFGSKSASGEGYLYNRFMRGWVDARQQEIRGVREKYAVLDAKAKEIFGDGVKNMADLIRKTGSLPKMTVGFWDGGEMRPHELTQGNLMYIYMVDKMSDGRMKLRHMGVTEEDVANITERLDPRLRQLADWMQGEFLAGTRKEYNETHKRMFGASMAEIEDYFPLKILANARQDNPEELDNPEMNEGISTKTGSIIKRTANTLDLDLLNADALNVILDHVAQMEHWNAYAEFNRDLNTLRTYKRFRNQVQNMTTVYGSGKELWKRFNEVCQLAAGTYRPPQAKLDKAATNIAKGVTAAKVSLRIFTALKQFLSMPAYASEAWPDLWLKNIAMPWEAWNWSMEHLPIFEERWKSRIAGDPRLLKSELDWKGWRNKLVQMASRVGMSPNAFVDALTVSIGAHTIYETRRARYLKEGYPEDQADKRAMQDAEVAYNQTQQSSEGAFLSPMQVDRSWLSVMFTVFRNSSMSYQRQLHDAVRNLKRDIFEKGNREKSIAFMAKQLVRDGIDEGKAAEVAKERYNRQIGKDAIRVAVFGFIMQFCWNLGAKLPYLLFGGDDDKRKEMWEDVWAHSMFGWAEGLTGGDVISEAGKMVALGEGNPEYLKKEMPVTSDVYKLLQQVGRGKYMEAVTDLVNLVVQAGIGVNPQTVTDAVLAVVDVCGGDMALANEATIFAMRVLQVPQSQIKEIYFDEVELSGEEASGMTFEQLAERYAKYQVKRGRFFTPWAWDDEELLEKERGKANKLIMERVGHMDDVDAEKVMENSYNLGDAETRKRIGSMEAKRQGGKDSYGSGNATKTAHGKVYMEYRDYVDMAGDITLQVAIREARESGDNQLRRALESYCLSINNVKKRLAYAESEEEIKEIMGYIREIRDEALKFNEEEKGRQ
ncbi:MAG: hypothetical protein IJT48_07760 [Bacteroidaceae bacterium]|nr:hypothetical protein [Bacteroidaceae bacterium]